MLTLPSTSQAAIRLRCLTPRIHDLGQRALYELLRELAAASSAVIDRAEAYAALHLHREFLAQHGGRDLPPTLKLINPCQD